MTSGYRLTRGVKIGKQPTPREVRARSPRILLVGVLVLTAILTVAILADLLAPADPQRQALQARLRPPVFFGGDWSAPLGTDALGRDYLSRLIAGTRVSIFVALATVAFSAVVGVAIGMTAGYAGGLFDRLMGVLGEVQIAFPGFLLALLVVSVTGGGAWVVVIVLSLSGWVVFARMARALVMTLRDTPYVEAAVLAGGSIGRVVFRHILPNVMFGLLTLVPLEFARTLIAESTLSFVGLGVQPPQTSWGLEMARGRANMSTAWWLIILPGVAIGLTVVSANLSGEWVKRYFDRRVRHGAR